MAKQRKDSPPPTKASEVENRRRTTMKQSSRTSNTIVDKLRRQSPALAQKRLRSSSSKTSETDRIAYVQTSTTAENNASDSNSGNNSVTLFQLDPQGIITMKMIWLIQKQRIIYKKICYAQG